MKNIIIFGMGKASEVVHELIDSEQALVVAFVDNRKEIMDKTYYNKPIIRNLDIQEIEYDYILIGSMNYNKIGSLLLSIGIADDKIIAPFNEKELYNPTTILKDIFCKDWKIVILNEIFKARFEKQEAMYQLKLNNLKYEILHNKEKIEFPIIKSAEEAIRLVKQGCSVCRFGDGEFEIMLGRNRAGFQEKSSMLASRLQEVLNNQNEQLLIGIADNYGNLDKYTNDAAHAIRMYLTEDVRKEHMALLDLKRVYYDAYLSRPYILYKDKENAAQRFDSIKEIWKNREVVIVEGEGTRMGVGNDLLAGAKSVQRVIAPSRNAFDKYDQIYEACTRFNKEKLFLIALGPVATVLAYDLYIQGYQALDIGHIDIEYEWFIRNASYKINIPEKYVNEILGGDTYIDIDVKQYNEELKYKIV